MKKYYAYMKTKNGYEKLGVSCYSTSRKKAAITFANKKKISLKDWLKSYNVVSYEHCDKLTIPNKIMSLEWDNLYMNYYFDFKKDRFILKDCHHSMTYLRQCLTIEQFYKFVNYYLSCNFGLTYYDKQERVDY